MKDFDIERAARNAAGEQFQIGGETFTVNLEVNPNALVAFETIDEKTTGIAETLKIVDDTILAMILDGDGTEGGAHARYRTLRARLADPITVSDLQALAEWLIGAQADRNPTQPGDSSPGPSLTGTTSTDDSSSPDIPEEQAA